MWKKIVEEQGVSKEVAKRMAEEADPARFHPDKRKVKGVSSYMYWAK